MSARTRLAVVFDGKHWPVTDLAAAHGIPYETVRVRAQQGKKGRELVAPVRKVGIRRQSVRFL